MRLSRHARQRAQERGISVADVTDVLDDPEVTFNDPRGNPCYIRNVGGRRIKVVTSAQNPDVVVTVIDLDN